MSARPAASSTRATLVVAASMGTFPHTTVTATTSNPGCVTAHHNATASSTPPSVSMTTGSGAATPVIMARPRPPRHGWACWSGAEALHRQGGGDVGKRQRDADLGVPAERSGECADEAVTRAGRVHGLNRSPFDPNHLLAVNASAPPRAERDDHDLVVAAPQPADRVGAGAGLGSGEEGEFGLVDDDDVGQRQQVSRSFERGAGFRTVRAPARFAPASAACTTSSGISYWTTSTSSGPSPARSTSATVTAAFAPGTTTIVFSACGPTTIMAVPVGALGSRVTPARSTP